MAKELKRLKTYCDTLLSCETPTELSENEAQVLEFGRELVRDALKVVTDYQKSCSPTAITLMGDLVYATSLMARFLPMFPFQDTQKRHGSALSMKAALKKAPAIALRKKLLVSQGYDLEALAKSRNKQCAAIVTEFTELCEANGVRGVGEKQINKYARELLKERHEKSGTS